MVTFRSQSTGWPRAPVSDAGSGPVGEMGRMGHQFTARTRPRFFPHSAPPRLSWAFVGPGGALGTFGLVLVEECGVQWGVVE